MIENICAKCAFWVRKGCIPCYSDCVEEQTRDGISESVPMEHFTAAALAQKGIVFAFHWHYGVLVHSIIGLGFPAFVSAYANAIKPGRSCFNWQQNWKSVYWEEHSARQWMNPQFFRLCATTEHENSTSCCLAFLSTTFPASMMLLKISISNGGFGQGLGELSYLTAQCKLHFLEQFYLELGA